MKFNLFVLVVLPFFNVHFCFLTQATHIIYDKCSMYIAAAYWTTQ